MNKKVDKKELEQYFAEARGWETAKVRESEKSRKTAWWVASAGVAIGFIGMASAFVQATHAPPPPTVLEVDHGTGAVKKLTGLKGGDTNYQEGINKYFTQWYVRYREGYSSDLAADYYKAVGIMSVGHEQQAYFNWFNPKNAQSPINLYRDTAQVKITIKGTSFIKPNVALVRYMKSVERGNSKPEISHWAAMVTFKYSGAPMREEDREVNPLGFQVVEYRNDTDSANVDGSELSSNGYAGGPVSTLQAAPQQAAPQPVAPAAAAPAPVAQNMDFTPLKAPVKPAPVVPAIDPNAN